MRKVWFVLCAAALVGSSQAHAVAIEFGTPVDVPARVGPAAPYGTAASVGDVFAGQPITDVDVLVDGLTHTAPEDLDLLVVSPKGTAVHLMKDAGGNNPLSGFDLVLSDEATDPLPDDAAIAQAQYRPTVFGSEQALPAPAPPPPYGTQLSAFDGESPIGNWTLYVADRRSGNFGAYGEWSIRITAGMLGPTTFPAAQAVAVPGSTGLGDPYPAVVNVSNAPGAVVSATATLVGVEHADAGELDALLEAPSGRTVMLMSDAGSGTAIAPPGVNLGFDDAAAGKLPTAAALLAGTYQPTDYEPETLPPPAPAPGVEGYPTALTSLVGGRLDGEWKLYASDDVAGGYGRLAGGFKFDVVSSGETGFGASSFVAAEGGDAAAVTLTRAFPEGPATVMVSRAGGSASATDVIGLPATVQFAPGEATHIVAIRPANDAVSEALERLDIAISSPLGPTALGTQTAASLTIFDNDPVPPNPAPLLTRLSLAPRSFRAAPGGASLSTPIGTRVSYRLSEGATTFVRVERARPGRRSGSRCVARTRVNSRARACTRYVAVGGSATHPGRVGTNSFRFRGRILGRRLPPSSYRLVLRARDATGKLSGVVRAGFRIVAR